MKLRLPSLLCTALLTCMTCTTTVHADTFLAEGVNPSDLEGSARFYDGGKGRDWDDFERAAYKIYNNNGADLSIFGDLASSITVPSYQSRLDCSNLYNDSGHCWAYTSSNMLQYWQTYYGVFSKKVGENKEAPVHGSNYDREHLDELGGTQSLKLNKLFYDSFDGKTGGSTNKAFGWYLAGENDWGGQNDQNSAPGYFSQYFAHYNDTHTTINGQNLSSLSAMSDSIKQAFGYSLQNGEWVQTTKGQIMHLELKSGNNSHAITCYGFETDADGNISALYVVNSDDSAHQLVKVYTKFEKYSDYDYRLSLHYDEACTGYETYNAWTVTGWSNINTPEVLKNMLAEYEKGNLTWMGNLESWKNATAETSDVNVLPTDESGWMIYAGSNTEHAGYYNAHYTTGRGVEFNDASDSGTVKVGEDISAPSMTVNNTNLAYTFEGGETQKTITVDEFSKTGSGSVVFDNVKLVAETVTTTSEVSFDELHVTGTLSAADNRIKANSLTLDGDATIGSLGEDSNGPTVGTTALTINGGTTTIRNWWAWTNLSSLELSDAARLDASGASLCVSGNITSYALGSSRSDAGINTKYCLYVGTEGKEGTGNVDLKGNITAGAYIKALGDVKVTGDVSTTGTEAEHVITIGGHADIGGKLSGNKEVTIGGNATIGGTATVGGDFKVAGALELKKGATVGGTTKASSLTMGADATLTTKSLELAGKLTGAAGASVEATESITLGGNASHVALKAQTLTVAEGVTLDSVDMVVTGGEISLTNVTIQGESSFSTGTDGSILTLRATNVTFVLEAPPAQTFALFSTDPLTQTQTGSSPLVISSSMLEGLRIEGSVTLDLSNWQSEIESGNYDSVVLELGDMSFSGDEGIQVTLGEEVLTQMAPDAGSTGSVTLTVPLQPSVNIPEPTTATLSLLALAGLAARRRRR